MQDGAPTRYVDFDRLGRELRVNERLHDGGIRYADKRYSARGLLARESDFLRSGESQSWTSYDSYDLLGRLTQKTVPKQLADVGGVNHGDLRTSYSYSGRKTTITLRGTASSFPSSKELTLERSADSLGRFLVSKDAAGGISKYWYDAHGNAIANKDAQGVVTRASYNASGQRTAAKQGVRSSNIALLRRFTGRTDCDTRLDLTPSPTDANGDLVFQPLARGRGARMSETTLRDMAGKFSTAFPGGAVKYSFHTHGTDWNSPGGYENFSPGDRNFYARNPIVGPVTGFLSTPRGLLLMYSPTLGVPVQIGRVPAVRSMPGR